jgi:hypothetical protein
LDFIDSLSETLAELNFPMQVEGDWADLRRECVAVKRASYDCLIRRLEAQYRRKRTNVA